MGVLAWRITVFLILNVDLSYSFMVISKRQSDSLWSRFVWEWGGSRVDRRIAIIESSYSYSVIILDEYFRAFQSNFYCMQTQLEQTGCC